jgi:hypothetical protein
MMATTETPVAPEAAVQRGVAACGTTTVVREAAEEEAAAVVAVRLPQEVTAEQAAVEVPVVMIMTAHALME